MTSVYLSTDSSLEKGNRSLKTESYGISIVPHLYDTGAYCIQHRPEPGYMARYKAVPSGNLVG